MINILGWIGNFGFISGAFLIARKRIEGFYLFALGNGLYIIYGLYLKAPSLWIISIYLFITNIYGLIHWRHDMRKYCKFHIIGQYWHSSSELCNFCIGADIDGLGHMENVIYYQYCPMCGEKITEKIKTYQMSITQEYLDERE